ncbi:hypothetical protein [Brachybacterium sp. GPGPB12]|uniref:hypothetical protein n=1 Tax=Brachybacterium sp. GPGPB12 TaxID=3023517 RepID=UPI00313439C7
MRGRRARAALELAPDGRVLGDLPDQLADAVGHVRVEARTAHSDARDAGDDSSAGARKTVRANLQEIIDVCERLSDPGEDDVVSVSRGQATGRASLQVAPLSVAAAMRGAILEDRTAVLTSATLALGGRFEPAAGEVGLARRGRVAEDEIPAAEDSGAWAGIDVGAPSTTGARASSTPPATSRGRAATAPRPRCWITSPSWWRPRAGERCACSPRAVARRSPPSTSAHGWT